MKAEVIHYERMVNYTEAWEDDRVPAGIYDEAVPAAEATQREGNRANAWLFFCHETPDKEESDDRREHHGRRDRAYRRAGF